MKPAGPKYADQNVVFNALGKQVLDNAWQGYNTCLFAYGQTGSGKSYSMVSIFNFLCQTINFKLLDWLWSEHRYSSNVMQHNFLKNRRIKKRYLEIRS